MATLLLRLAAPMQAWGSDSKFETRQTDCQPTKSGVVGLLAAALGIRRSQPERLAALVQLRFGVRVDREGALLQDYHMVHKVGKTKKDSASYVTYRYYLADAVFLVGLESADIAFLQQLEAALCAPAFPLFLGRRSCPPTLPLCLGIRDGSLIQVLKTEPPLVPEAAQPSPKRIIVDADPTEPGAIPRHDLPLSFSPMHRQFGYRAAREIYVPQTDTALNTEQDPFAEL